MHVDCSSLADCPLKGGLPFFALRVRELPAKTDFSLAICHFCCPPFVMGQKAARERRRDWNEEIALESAADSGAKLRGKQLLNGDRFFFVCK